MSFQGDVAGLGLGELLQGLARGGREGVLTLYGGGLSATVGVLSGQIHLLPEPDEDPEIWRKRAGQTWPDDENERVDSLRMVDIAYAARLERMFELLDCEGVHFRFEQGALPNSDPLSTDPALAELTTERPKELDARVPVFCAPISVEFLLLEHARLSDECNAHGDSKGLSIHEVLCPLIDASQLPGDKLFAECDGISNVIEVSDRLSWPLRQTKAAVFARLAHGHLRLASANELAALTRTELVKNRFLRAASRLSGWAQSATPGVPDQGEAELLIEEWNGGKLVLALAGTSSSDTRTVLRRMELAEADPKASLARWREICKHHRHDLIAEVHVLRLGLALEDETQKPGFAELMKVARHFLEQGRLMRAGAMLTAAASRNPEGTPNRLELGNRMLASGMVEEATPWLLEACRTMIAGGLADKALAPLRALVAADPTNRDARSLFNVARASSTQGKAKTRNLWIALAMSVLLALAAVVQVHNDNAIQERLSELESSNQRPEILLRTLDTDFPESSNARVIELKHLFAGAVRKRETSEREEWIARYTKCATECESGDALLGLDSIVELPAPPKLTLVRDAWPTVSDTLQVLAARLEQSVGELSQGASVPGSDDSQEKRIAEQVRDLIALGNSKPRSDALDGFLLRMNSLLDTLHDRDEQRSTALKEAKRRDDSGEQETMLAAARARSKQGDLEGAWKAYQSVIARDTAGMLTKALAPEMHLLEQHRSAVARARELALAGRHAEAINELQKEKACPSPSDHLLPWRVISTPVGAHVRFNDGTLLVTPCTIESAPGKPTNFTLELKGFEQLPVHTDGPANVAVLLSRLPQRWWRAEGKVEAAPVAVQDDHLLVDRQGGIVRMGADSALRWQHQFDSLSGIARAPVILPGRPDALLCLTEDGNAWVVGAADGHLEGPWDVGSPPIAGPYVQDGSVRARFSTGKECRWDSRLKPEVIEHPADEAQLSPAELQAAHGSDAGLAMLRRRDAGLGAQFDSPYANEWTVEVRDKVFLVRERAEQGRSFFVRRSGEWSYLAWEAPSTSAAQGRLWISDGVGLRGYEP